ncbi:Antibiotic biosynthesis monooxygenase [Emticicia oligotrophica DSM 17448]|uniref:Antibiotic biosynthesis monooxygenase n=1 Tax=Emticicia oligotrophica (strain DSM 17448 / CIP 109782 / MTCC 6937 / GPTSA100-15) TaxID=929562 RepID=A0ABN4ALS1_EMTOG|nr:antibiotic biosynthesis monooxygenase family protein [Emticicia oligotrophica]AFK03267.1 Antibiotic biosynthesis monooxygenase [Emticicia oligotrophica DSM 17448]
MLIRYVRMTFQEDKTEEFQEIFNSSKDKIRAMAGCSHLELLRDINQPNIFMTHSHWESEKALNNYRDSELFRSTWAKTKILFADKPLAFSVESITVA